MNELYIGLMSGTSMDAIDAALLDFSADEGAPPKLIATYKHELSSELKTALIQLRQPSENEINQMGTLDHEMGELFATTALALLKETPYKSEDIQAIGSHGQSIRHYPFNPQPFTIQIGDPNIIAARTGITTVADFRRRDIALNGQGAPLAPAFHHSIFRSDKEDRVILNIGGIANITLLSKDKSLPVIGFDTGPGNTLLDGWALQHIYQAYDEDGNWAAGGKINETLLQQLLLDKYLTLSPPKSTGPEYFHMQWLYEQLALSGIKNPIDAQTAQNIQTTLTEFTAITIAQAIERFASSAKTILVCGGGIRNRHLIARLKEHCKPWNIHSTADFGLDPEWVEAAAFAWLARQTMKGFTANLPSVTGAKHPTILGGIYPRNRAP
jgi:anhydro-N-acetylmuramic acid kinase